MTRTCCHYGATGMGKDFVTFAENNRVELQEEEEEDFDKLK